MKTGQCIKLNGSNYTVMLPKVERGKKGWSMWSHKHNKQLFMPIGSLEKVE